MNPLIRWKFETAMHRWQYGPRRPRRAIRNEPSRFEGLQIINRTGLPNGWEFHDSQGNALRLRIKALQITGEVGEMPQASLTLFPGPVNLRVPDCLCIVLPEES